MIGGWLQATVSWLSWLVMKLQLSYGSMSDPLCVKSRQRPGATGARVRREAVDRADAMGERR
jgi:hypothetical protein